MVCQSPVEEVNHVHSQPIVEIFAFWQLHHLSRHVARQFFSGQDKVDLSEVDPGVEAGLRLLVQRVLHRPWLELLLRPESLLLIEHLAEFAQVHLDCHSLMPSGIVFMMIEYLE